MTCYLGCSSEILNQASLDKFRICVFLRMDTKRQSMNATHNRCLVCSNQFVWNHRNCRFDLATTSLNVDIVANWLLSFSGLIVSAQAKLGAIPLCLCPVTFRGKRMEQNTVFPHSSTTAGRIFRCSKSRWAHLQQWQCRKDFGHLVNRLTKWLLFCVQ